MTPRRCCWGRPGRLEPLDLDLARETYLEAWGAAMFAGRLADSANVADVSRAASAAAPTGGSTASVGSVAGWSCTSDHRGPYSSCTGTGAGRWAPLPATGSQQRQGFGGAGWPWCLPSCCGTSTGGLRSPTGGSSSPATRARSALLPIVLTSRCVAASMVGEFATANSLIVEADAIAEATETRMAPYATLVLGALRGREAEISESIAATIQISAAEGQGIGVQFGKWVAAILYNGLGRYDEALAAAQEASEIIPELYISTWALPELIEAATRTGEMARAVEALQRLVVETNVGDSDWGLGIQARARALVSDGEEAERSYREAIERLGRTHLRPELARAHMLYGEWLRRQNRRIDAREQLRRAYDMFSEIGMMAFGDRALHELRATGETVRKREDDTRNDLTPQEEQIARLALEGRTNPEIAAQLYISARTVEWHLRKVFMKLGVTSRRGLRDALPGRGGTGRGQ